MGKAFQGRFVAILAALFLGVGVAYFAASTIAVRRTVSVWFGAPVAEPRLVMATCTGGLAETPDLEFSIPLDKCDASIDAIDVKSGFLSKWTICDGAKSFEIVLKPRAVKVTSDALHCSSTRSEVSVTFIGSAKN
jgi:hypothetical protein